MKLITLKSDMTDEERINALQSNALILHQNSVGQGEILIDLLKRTITKVEDTQKRIQFLNTAFFFFGLAVLALGIIVSLFGDSGGAVWGSMLGVGSLTSAVSLFVTTPMKRISKSIKDLIQLETAFLDYIRVVGEIDTGFQWQYIENMAGKEGTDIEILINETHKSMQKIISNTMALINKYSSDSEYINVQEIRSKFEQLKRDLNARLRALESKKQNSH